MSERESDYTDSFTADVLNQEPVVYKGLTEEELKTLFLFSLVAFAPLAIFIAIAIGMLMMAVVLIILFPVLCVIFFAGKAQRMRRGKPPGFLEHTVYKFMKMNAQLFVSSGRWSLGRNSRNPIKKKRATKK